MAYQLLKMLLLPPANLFLLGFTGWLVSRRWRRLGQAIVVLSALLLYVLATPLVAHRLVATLETFPHLAPDASADVRAGAIVVLGAGARPEAEEFGGDTLDGLSLERIRYGARLARQLDLPILVAGGTPSEALPPVAPLMARVLADEFGASVGWQEAKSTNTRENARYAKEILTGEGVTTIYLVTHAWHMPRAKAAFERTGLTVLPAPTAAARRNRDINVLDFVPSATALWLSFIACHEHLGALWYDLS